MQPGILDGGHSDAAVSPSRHPRGLYTLFFTEMWERFSYYGMRALLVLFMVDTAQDGGLGLSDRTATAIYGLYTAAVYLAALPGGWIADRFLGAQRSVWYGGIIIACGHFTLAIQRPEAFYAGLVLVVIGTGLLKPNVTVMVGNLYPAKGPGRDAGFSIFYMGINLGALVGPLICSALGERINWHYGFAAAGVGMVLGLVQYRLSASALGEAGRRPGQARTGTRDWLLLACLAVAVVAAVVSGLVGIVPIDVVAVAGVTKYIIVAVGTAYFLAVFLVFKLTAEEKRRVGAIVVLLVASAMFWAGLEQAGSSLNLFAERYTQREFMGWIIPTGWFQSLAPLFVITLAPVAASVWLALGRRNRDLSPPSKFAFGLLFLAAGFVVMSVGSRFVAAEGKVWPTWLITTYLLHSVGELCLSPVGLSSVTKLAPKRLVGQLMGTWFLATSLGNLIAGLIAGSFSADAVQQMPRLYMQIVLTTAGTGLLLFVLARPLKNWMR